MASANVDSSVELWKDIAQYEGFYQVSNLGRVRVLPRPYFADSKIIKSGHILSPKKSGKGYLSVQLCVEGIKRRFYVHRLVGLAFIPNPDNRPQIDHRNTDVTDNRASNLKWATNLENAANPISKAKYMKNHFQVKSVTRRVAQIDLKTKETIKEWDCMMDAQRETGIGIASINHCCRGRIRKSHGFIWRYLD